MVINHNVIKRLPPLITNISNTINFRAIALLRKGRQFNHIRAKIFSDMSYTLLYRGNSKKITQYIIQN